MPKAKSKTAVPCGKDESRNNPMNFKDVDGLSSAELNKLCRDNGIDTKFGKKGKVNLLCSIMCISTTGKQNESTIKPHVKHHSMTVQQINHYQKLTPGFMASLKDWQKDLSCIQDIDDRTVKDYLLNIKTITDSEMRHYKITRPYQMKDFVHSMKIISSSDSFTLVQAQCNPSQSTSADDVKVIFFILDAISSTPYGGYCTCTVGFSQSCSHIGAVLFRIADLVASGETEFPDDPTCTDRFCQWTDPKGANVKPKQLDDINVSKSVKDGNCHRRTLNEYGRLVLPPNVTSKPTLQEILKLRDDLFKATAHTGRYVAAVQVLTPHNFSDHTYSPHAYTSLPDILDEHDARMVPSFMETATSTPLPVAFYPAKLPPEAFISSLQYSKEDVQQIEEMTRGQNTNLEWYHQRMGSIGASVCGSVLRYEEGAKINADSLTGRIMGYKQRKIVKPSLPSQPNLKYGIVQEKIARSRYMAKECKIHHNLHIKESGLIVHSTKPYLRVSPDGIIYCGCHPKRLLEIKCPYSSADIDVASGVKSGKIKYLQMEEVGFKLCQNSSDGYYAQVQMCMAVAEVKSCDFVVYTKVDLQVIKVPFNEAYWLNRLEPALIKFFSNHVTMAILRDQNLLTGHQQSTLEALADSDSDNMENLENVNDGDSASVMEVDEDANSKNEKESDSVGIYSTEIVCCKQCEKILPDEPEHINEDNSNASVACDCPCGCNVWHCWPCANFSENKDALDMAYFCQTCLEKCKSC